MLEREPGYWGEKHSTRPHLCLPFVSIKFETACIYLKNKYSVILGKVQRTIKLRFQMFPESSKTCLTCCMKKIFCPLHGKKYIFNLFLMSRGYCNFAGMHGRYTAITIRTAPQLLTPWCQLGWCRSLFSDQPRPDTPGSASHKQGSTVSSTSCETTTRLSVYLPTARIRPARWMTMGIAVSAFRSVCERFQRTDASYRWALVFFSFFSLAGIWSELSMCLQGFRKAFIHHII